MEMKYVILDKKGPIAFIVPKHSDMVVHGSITSAGFFRIKINKKASVETYGYSHSLKTMNLPYTPSPEDARILEVYFGIM